MAGMLPAVWGPMVWRCFHKMAFLFDEMPRSAALEDARNTFQLFLLLMAWLLPCSDCRASYTAFLDEMAPAMTDAFRKQGVGRLIFELHNLVNSKLGVPQFKMYDIARRRAAVWPMEAFVEEFFSVLFIIVLNYDANKELDKRTRYRDFLNILPALMVHLGDGRAAHAMAFLADLDSWASQGALLGKVYNAYVAYRRGRAAPPEPLASLVARLDLCRASDAAANAATATTATTATTASGSGGPNKPGCACGK